MTENNVRPPSLRSAPFRLLLFGTLKTPAKFLHTPQYSFRTCGSRIRLLEWREDTWTSNFQ